MFYVLAKSPYQKIEDLKGKAMGFVDPNSTSGNNMPRFVLDGMGIDPETFFSKTIFAGSHENAVLALAQGTVDVCANWWNDADNSNLTRMLNKDMLKNADGSLMTKDDFRIILKSPLIINSPYAYLADLPDEAKKAIRKAFFDAATKAPEAFAKLSDGKNRPWEPVDQRRLRRDDRTREVRRHAAQEEELSASRDEDGVPLRRSPTPSAPHMPSAVVRLPDRQLDA